MDVDVSFEAEYQDGQIQLNVAMENKSSRQLSVRQLLLSDPSGNTRDVLAEPDASVAMDEVTRAELFEGTQLVFRAHCVFQLGGHDRSVHFIKDCWLAWDKEEQALRVAGSIYQEAESQAMQALASGDVDGAIPLFLQALKEAERQKNPSALDNVLGNLGSAYLTKEDDARAAFFTRNALEVEDRLFSSPNKLNWLLNLAWAQLSSGQGSAATLSFEKALARAREAGDERSIGVAMAGIANCLRSEGKIDEAESFFLQAISSARKIGDKVALSRRLGNLGLAYDNAGRHGEAIGPLSEALETAEGIGDRTYVVRWLETLSSACGRTGDPRPAIVAGERLVSSSNLQWSPQELLNCLGLAGLNYFSGRQLDKAKELWGRALALSREVEDPRSEMRLLLNMGNIGLLTNNLPEASELWRAAFDKAKALRDLEPGRYCLESLKRLPEPHQDAGVISRMEDEYEQMKIDRWLDE